MGLSSTFLSYTPITATAVAVAILSIVAALWRIRTLHASYKKLGEDLAQSEIQITELRKSLALVKSKDATYDHASVGKSEKIAELEDAKLAVLNLLEDLGHEKDDASNARARVEAVISSIADGVIVVDTRMNIVMCNPAAIRMFDLRENNYVGKSWSTICTFKLANGELLPEDHYPMHKAQAIRKPDHRLLLLVRNGGDLPLSINASPVISQGKVVGAVGIFRDNTLEYQLDRAKSEFVSVASHQLRTPLTSIMWYVESLSNGDFGNLGTGMIEPISVIRESSRRMMKLTSALLNVSRIESGNLSIVSTPCSISEIVDEVILETEVQWKPRGTQIYFNPPSDLPSVNIDRDLTKIVIQNLITNAIKYTPDGGKVTVGVDVKGKEFEVTVADNGIGIPAAAQGRIFQKLFRAENANRSTVDGTGLGLYIARAIVEKFGGTISFVSKEGRGTTFRFTMPLAGVKTTPGNRALITDF